VLSFWAESSRIYQRFIRIAQDLPRIFWLASSLLNRRRAEENSALAVSIVLWIGRPASRGQAKTERL
jgi:hypothetical protein